ncbi:MAG: methyltransferase domain-containing protein [Rhizomicrobium sp.]
MTGTAFDGKFTNKVSDFDAPTQLPVDDEQRKQWQLANKAWWEGSPMRYDWRDELESDDTTKAYFAEIDRRFFSSVRRFLPWHSIPFDTLISFDKLRSLDVLEIGVGFGSHAQLLAPRSGSYVGIDLTAKATAMTKSRLALFNVTGKILQMDAEAMDFPEESFDFIWSWGVIHHSADTGRILKEMHRVLRPGGQATIMVYYRSWWSYYLFAFLKSILDGKLPRSSHIREVRQQTTDGAIARYYTRTEWDQFAGGFFTTKSSVYGMCIEAIPLPHGMLKSFFARILPDRVARFMTHRLAMGSFLIAQMTKK